MPLNFIEIFEIFFLRAFIPYTLKQFKIFVILHFNFLIIRIMYNYQQSNRFFAQAADDIKDIAESEIGKLGASDISHAYRGLYFSASKEVLYRINYNSRLINRVLAPLLTFDCHSDKYLYKTAMEIEWKDFLSTNNTFAVFATVTQSKIKHSKFAALRLKDAIADYFREKTSRRPTVDTRNPDVWFNLHIENNKAVISLDTSGGSLHRRGYRAESVSAPMSETLAASLIVHSGWNGSKPLYDPFCGSGTILCEAYMKQAKIPASIFRNKFGLEMLPDFEPELWRKVKSESKKDILQLENSLISGSDISSGAVETALRNFKILDKNFKPEIKQKDIFKIDDLKNRTIICNPPYGLRLNKNEDLSGFYKMLGDYLKQKCTGSDAFIYFGDRKYLKNIGLKPSWKRPLVNGGLDGRFAKFELY